MRIFRTILSCIWRLWFYVWMAIVIILLSPFLLATIWSEKSYANFYRVARIWAKMTFYGIGMRYHVKYLQELEKGKSYMFIANHTSMLDIMMMYMVVKDNPFVFVGKKELAKLPLFGFFYKKTCILVDRSDAKSRYQVFKEAQARLDKGLSVCIFPEGGVSDDRSITLDTFKDGAFRLAITHQIPIVPIAFGKLKFYFPFVWGLGFPGKVPALVLPFIETKGKEQDDKKEIKKIAYNTIFEPVDKWEKEYRKKREV